MRINGNVTNGKASVQIPTTGLTSGMYLVLVDYTQNDYYNGASGTGLLLLNERSWITADITPSSTEWTETPSVDGVHSSTNTYTCWKTMIPDNVTIQITGRKQGTTGAIELRDRINNNRNSLCWNIHAGITKWGQIGESTLASLNWQDGDFTLEITKQNGVLSYDLNGETGTVDINSSLLNNSYLSFIAQNGSIVLTSVRYKLNQTGGGN